MKNIRVIAYIFMLSTFGCGSETDPVLIEQLFFECYNPNSFGTISPNRIDGIPKTCKRATSVDEFEAASSQNWQVTNASTRSYAITNGKYVLESKNTTSWYVAHANSNKVLADAENYELTASIMLTKSSSSTSVMSFFWGDKQNLEDLYEIAITRDGKYMIRKLVASKFQTPIVNLKTSSNLKVGQFNTITIRLYLGVSYIFINNALTEVIQTKTLAGKSFGFSVGAMSEAQIDWVSVTSINL